MDCCPVNKTGTTPLPKTDHMMAMFNMHPLTTLHVKPQAPLQGGLWHSLLMWDATKHQKREGWYAWHAKAVVSNVPYQSHAFKSYHNTHPTLTPQQQKSRWPSGKSVIPNNVTVHCDTRGWVIPNCLHSAVVGQEIKGHSVAPTKADLGCILPTTTNVAVGLCHIVLLVHGTCLVVDTHVDPAAHGSSINKQSGDSAALILSLSPECWALLHR